MLCLDVIYTLISAIVINITEDLYVYKYRYFISVNIINVFKTDTTSKLNSQTFNKFTLYLERSYDIFMSEFFYLFLSRYKLIKMNEIYVTKYLYVYKWN